MVILVYFSWDNDHEPVDGMDIWFLEYCDFRPENLGDLKGNTGETIENAQWYSPEILTGEWSIPGYIDTYSGW